MKIRTLTRRAAGLVPLGAVAVLLTALALPASAAATPPVLRLGGVDRIDTAIKISQDYVPNVGAAQGAAQSVVLARSDSFPDALAGVPLAVAKAGPLLLTPPGSLDPRVLTEIQRVLAPGATVYLMGGEGALSAAVATGVTQAGYVTQRFAGTDRFERQPAAETAGAGKAGEQAEHVPRDVRELLAGAERTFDIGKIGLNGGEAVRDRSGRAE